MGYTWVPMSSTIKVFPAGLVPSSVVFWFQFGDLVILFFQEESGKGDIEIWNDEDGVWSDTWESSFFLYNQGAGHMWSCQQPQCQRGLISLPLLLRFGFGFFLSDLTVLAHQGLMVIFGEPPLEVGPDFVAAASQCSFLQMKKLVD